MAEKAVDPTLEPEALARVLPSTAFAFKGYNTRNLGRSPELLAHPVYGPFLERRLREAEELGSDVLSRPMDLVGMVRNRHEETLADYPCSILLVVAAELAQMDILKTVHGIEMSGANMAYGFSLGELAALAAADVLTFPDSVSVPLLMANDAIDLAKDVTLGVLFTRSGRAIERRRVHVLCHKINVEGKGVIGVSAYLAPNSMLLLGQGDTIAKFKARIGEVTEERASVRMNGDKWPPLHTPIIWQRNIADRSQVLMQRLASGFEAPSLPLLSLATGDFPYDGTNTRDVVAQWIDHPQCLWEAVDTTLARGVDTVVHVGPEPNIIPATFKRLAANVSAQTRGTLGMQALSRIARRKWLSTMLPKRANLLRAPHIRQVILEDWLLEQEVE